MTMSVYAQGQAAGGEGRGGGGRGAGMRGGRGTQQLQDAIADGFALIPAQDSLSVDDPKYPLSWLE